MPLTDGVTVRFINRDLSRCVQPTGVDEELPALLTAIDAVPAGLSTIVDLEQMREWILNGETCKPCSSIRTQQDF